MVFKITVILNRYYIYLIVFTNKKCLILCKYIREHRRQADVEIKTPANH